MATANRKIPKWAAKYARLKLWTRNEVRNLLCGFPPDLSADAPDEVPVRLGKGASDRDRRRRDEKINNRFIQDEQQRAHADRYIRDAIAVGDLKVLDPPFQQILKKVTNHLTAHDIEALRRAIAHDRTCAASYSLASDDVIRWATPRRDLFPCFPFPETALSPAGAGERVTTDTLLTPDLARRAAWVKEHTAGIPAKRLPDRKTLDKIQRGVPVTERVLQRLADAAGVDRKEVP